MQYEKVTQKVLFDNDVLAALMSERKYDLTHQNGNCSMCVLRFFEKSVRYQKASSLHNITYINHICTCNTLENIAF
jgi:hypothetical protein